MDAQDFLEGLNNAFATRQPDKVEAYLRTSLIDAERENKKSTVITILNEMIGFFRNTSNYKEALWASEQAIATMRTLGQEHSAAFGTTLLNAATAYRAAGQTQRALELYHKTEEIYAEHLSENDARLAGLYNNISSLHETLGNHEKAYNFLKKALNVLLQLEGTRTASATVYTNLATVLFALKREEEAKEALHSAMELFEKENDEGKRAPHYAAALANLAATHYRTKQYVMAAKVYEKTLTHLKNCYGENKDYAVTQKNCAIVLDALGEHGKAENYRKNADRILQQINS